MTQHPKTVKKLFPPQEEILQQGFMTSRDNWVISMPTGSGKTLLGEWVMLDSVKKGFKAVYLCPLKAIAEEKYQEWQQQYASIRFGLFTGDAVRKGSKYGRPDKSDILLCTPERFDSFLRGWRKNIPWLADVDCLVIDELHLLCAGSRGARLESLITRIKRLNPFTQIIGLSATMANKKELAHWLDARLFSSTWRLVPVHKRFRHFSKIAEKTSILIEEVESTLDDDGQILVFTNSRRRAERLAKTLQKQNIYSTFHHAGLDRQQRLKVEASFRNKTCPVLVATSTLEMGINLPARKVIIFDAYSYSEQNGFQSLPVLNYLQRAGRAGRPGNDTNGEAVLLLPKWSGKTKQYTNEELEPIRSQLFDTNLLAEQILAEISSRLSITEYQLEKCFGDKTVWRLQGGSRNLSIPLRLLQDAEMVTETSKDSHQFLNASALGRLATQLFLSPESVISIKKSFLHEERLHFFDLLLLCCLLRECEPKLWFQFEEIDNLGDSLLTVPSFFLDQPLATLSTLCTWQQPRHILAAIKTASLLYQRINAQDDDQLIDTFSCYPSDLHLLVENSTWLLNGISAIFAAIRKKHTADNALLKRIYKQRQQEKPLPEQICSQLAIMVQYGISGDAISLVRISGIGGKKAKILLQAGYQTVDEIALADVEEIAELNGFGKNSGAKLIERAEKLVKDDTIYYEEDQVDRKKKTIAWPHEIDPYRLRRAMELEVLRQGQESAIITGGSEPRKVFITGNGRQTGYSCECPDYQKRQQPCKHILRVQLAGKEKKKLLKLIQQLQTLDHGPLRYNLGALWMQGSERVMNYDKSRKGHSFIRQANRKRR